MQVRNEPVGRVGRFHWCRRLWAGAQEYDQDRILADAHRVPLKAPGGGMQTGGAKHKETQPPPWSECFLPWMVGLLRRRDASSVKSPNVGALWIKVKETLVPVQ